MRPLISKASTAPYLLSHANHLSSVNPNNDASVACRQILEQQTQPFTWWPVHTQQTLQAHEFNLLWTAASSRNLNENQWREKLHFPQCLTLTASSELICSILSELRCCVSVSRRFDVLNITINNVFSIRINCFASVSCSLHPKLKRA